MTVHTSLVNCIDAFFCNSFILLLLRLLRVLLLLLFFCSLSLWLGLFCHQWSQRWQKQYNDNCAYPLCIIHQHKNKCQSNKNCKPCKHDMNMDVPAQQQIDRERGRGCTQMSVCLSSECKRIVVGFVKMVRPGIEILQCKKLQHEEEEIQSYPFNRITVQLLSTMGT